MEDESKQSYTVTEEPLDKEFLKRIIDTGNNYIVSYPAGSGKTTAIRDYIVARLRKHDLNRKIIYVAPTQSLLDNMWEQIMKEANVIRTEVFNYHSNSPAYGECKIQKQKMQEAIKQKIDSALVILITHERMKFDIVDKFIAHLDGICGMKPLVFLDESIEDCNIVSTTTYILDGILAQTGLIDPGQTHLDFKPEKLGKYTNAKRVYECLSRRVAYDVERRCTTIRPLAGLGMELANNVGFSDKADLTDSIVEARFLNLYSMIAMSIAQKLWVEADDKIYLSIPIAIHESWKTYAQIIVADATAFIHPSMCKGYNLIVSSDWKGGLIKQIVSPYRFNTRTKIEENLGSIPYYLDNIDLRKYRRIYIVTFLGKAITETYKYLQEKYPDYTIEYRDRRTTEDFLASDIDNSTDELYSDSSQMDKIIYLTNFGRTRGSNKFRNCDCVIQIGNYRANPRILDFLQVIYPGLTDNQLALTNYIQELYRGIVRCGQPMAAYALLDQNFYDYLRERAVNFHFAINNSQTKPFTGSVVDKIKNKQYGMNTNLVESLYEAKMTGKVIQKEELCKMCEVPRLIDARERLLNLYVKYPEIKEEIFTNYKSKNKLKEALTVANKHRELNLQL